MATEGEAQAEALASTHRLKLKPPTYDGNYATFEEWKYKFSAYMGLQDNIFPQLLSRAERATTVLTNAELLGAATTIEEGEKWTQLCNNLKYILINITSGPAATICRQYQDAMGLEVYRQLCNRFAIPVGTRSIGYLTKLLKPKFDTNNFEESFSTWEFELARYERDNNAQLPDQVKIAVLMNETTGPLQQHLHLNASATPTYAEVRTTIMEYYRTTTAFSRLQQQSSSAVSSNQGGGPAPMDIGATYKGKGKGKGKSKGKGFNKGGHKGKGYQQGKGYGGYGNYNKGKGKGKQQQWYQPKGIEKGNKGKSKGIPNKGKGKNPTAICYRCGQQGHLAKDCRTAVYNMAETPQEQNQDGTSQWYDPNSGYDNYWYSNGQSGNYNTQPVQQQQQHLALPAPQTNTQTPTIQLVGALGQQAASAHNEATTTAQAVQQQRGDNEVDIMIDSGAATHVCPTWFAPDTPLYPLQHGQGPRLRTATDEDIPVHGYKWVYMHNTNKQTIVVPFYVCDVTQPIMSVTRLAEQGFNTQLNETPTITHTKGFNSALKQREGLYFLPVVLITLPANLRLEVSQTAEGTIAKIAPVTLTPTGMEVLRNKNDLWTFNSQGFLVRIHRTTRKALFMPDSRCPVPTERLENYRRTIIQRPNNNTEVIEEAYQDLDKKQQKRIIQGNNWTGETWFKVKRGTTLPGNIPPQPALPPAKGPTTLSQQTTEDQPQAPMYRHNVKKPLTEGRPTGQAMTTTQPHQTAIPHPKEVSPTQDYWIKEGPYWKRVHVQPRRDMYIPQQTDDGPDVTRLTTWRQTIVKPTSGNRGYRIDDDWTTKRRATLDIEWTGSTNFEENTAYKDEFITDEPEEQQEAKRAKGVPTPQQPTEQERREHELTHLPYRSWCPTCVQSKGRQDNHPKQTSKTPVIQVDLMYYKALGEKQTTSVLTAVDVETGMCMAVQLEDKTQHVQYLSVCLQQFLMECGRTHAILNNTVLQSDQEDFIISLLKMVATAMGSNIAVRQAPAYTSQAQGSVERFHRTLAGQVRALKLQLETNYGIKLNSKHPIMPWLVKHAAYLLNRYSIHSDGNTSYYRRWGKEHKTPICEFGETILYMLPTAKQMPKMEARFYPAIWLGKDNSTNENILGISNKVVKARTIRRQIKPDKYNKQLMDIINSSPAMIPPTTPSIVVLPQPAAAKQQTTTSTQTQQSPQPKAMVQPHATTPPALTDLPMATAPATQPARLPLPMPTQSKREVADEITQGSSPKQARTTERATAASRPDTAQEPPTTRMRISQVTVTTKKGQKIEATSNEDEQEIQAEKILLEPWVSNTEGLDKEQTTEGMKQEIKSMKEQGVYTEVHISQLTPEQRKKIIKSRWVLRQKGNTVRARIVAKGYTEEINDNDDIFASTPIFCVLRMLLVLALCNNWMCLTGDISTAFLHAAAATADLFMYPPAEFYNTFDQIVWRLNKAIYGLRSSPKAWQNHLAEVMQQLGLRRLVSEPNVYATPGGDSYILCYVDDLLFIGQQETVNKLFRSIQQHLLLRPTGELTVGNTISFLGRNICNKGDYYEISLADSYTTDLLEEASMLNCNSAPAPGNNTLKATSEMEQELNKEEHAAYRRMVGKLQWMTYTRPDIGFATKELARALTQPTTADQQKLKHLLRYIKGTQHYKQYIRPTTKTPTAEAVPDIEVFVDSDWAGCATTRKSTTGFLVKVFGATIHYGSRTQATIALSSAEAELYAINTGATEALHISNFMKEALNMKKINIRIHTDSSSGKSMATRIGASKKAKHIELKHLFIQQLVAHDLVRIVKINTTNNPADIFTKYVATETLLRHISDVGINTQRH